MRDAVVALLRAGAVVPQNQHQLLLSFTGGEVQPAHRPRTAKFGDGVHHCSRPQSNIRSSLQAVRIWETLGRVKPH